MRGVNEKLTYSHLHWPLIQRETFKSHTDAFSGVSLTNSLFVISNAVEIMQYVRGTLRQSI